MIDINKTISEGNYSFIIKTDEGKFEISFSGGSDLYFKYIDEGNYPYINKSQPLKITKENYYLYSLFKELYEDVKNHRVFKVHQYELDSCSSNQELDVLYREKERWNEQLKTDQSLTSQRLFKKGVIEWHCDDHFYDDGSVLKISECDESYAISFERGIEEFITDYHSFKVRIRNSGSRYAPYNTLFMRLYSKLAEYDPKRHQIDIEEYQFQKKYPN